MLFCLSGIFVPQVYPRVYGVGSLVFHRFFEVKREPNMQIVYLLPELIFFAAQTPASLGGG